ncbi:MAG: SpoIIIAH-like family protein [Bacillota bacterium]
MKKYGVLIGLLVLLVVAVYVNVRINKSSTVNPKPTMSIGVETAASAGGEEEYFEVFRADRQSMRDMELEYLETIITNDDTDAETLADAQQQKLAIVEGMEKEFTIESLLKAKGFEDAAVTVHSGSINVVIKAETLSAQQVAQVLDIVCRETGEEAENVKVTTAKG